MKRILTAAILASLCLPAAARGTAVVRSGDYGVECGVPGKQCWWTIKQVGANEESSKYSARYNVADRMDHTKVSCTIDASGFGFGTKGSAEIAMETKGRKSVSFVLQGNADGSVTSYTSSGSDLKCKGADALGELSPIGD